MAYGFNNTAGQYINRSADIFNCNNPYTVSFWIRFPGFATNDHIFAVSDGTSNNRDFLKTDGTTATLLNLQSSIGGVNTAVVGTTTLVVDTWYHLAIIRTANNSLLLYLNGALEITNSRNIADRALPVDIYIGADHGGTNPLNGWITNLKIWASALSVNQILTERRSIRPQTTPSMYGWWPTIKGSTRALDFSGNGRTWTENGTIAEQDNPPTAWNGATPTLLRTSAIILPRFDLEGYRFRNDDGSETTATWRQAQDTPDSIARSTGFRLRTLVNVSFDPAASNLRLEYRKPDSLDWRKVQ